MIYYFTQNLTLSLTETPAALVVNRAPNVNETNSPLFSDQKSKSKLHPSLSSLRKNRCCVDENWPNSSLALASNARPHSTECSKRTLNAFLYRNVGSHADQVCLLRFLQAGHLSRLDFHSPRAAEMEPMIGVRPRLEELLPPRSRSFNSASVMYRKVARALRIDDFC